MDRTAELCQINLVLTAICAAICETDAWATIEELNRTKQAGYVVVTSMGAALLPGEVL